MTTPASKVGFSPITYQGTTLPTRSYAFVRRVLHRTRVGLFVLAGAAGFAGSLAVPWPLALLAAGLVGLAIARGRLVALDEAAAPRALRVLFASSSALALVLVLLCRLTVFIIDRSQVALPLPNQD